MPERVQDVGEGTEDPPHGRGSMNDGAQGGHIEEAIFAVAIQQWININ